MKFEMLDDGKLHLTQAVASGMLGEDPYSVSATIPGNSIIVDYQNKRAILEIQDIVRAGLDFIDETIKAGEGA